MVSQGIRDGGGSGGRPVGQVLPNFLIIGAQKSGTSWLADMLGQHPEVFLYRKKEIHFFDVHFQEGIAWYEKHFRERSTEAAVGEKTPTYLGHPSAAQRIRDVLGERVRLIVSLPHPVDRAYSGYWHGMRRGRIPTVSDFEKCFREDERLRSESMYGHHIRRFLEHWPERNLLVLISEEMMADRRGALANCFEALGVTGEFEVDDAEKRVNVAKGAAAFSAGLHRIRGQVNHLPPWVRVPLVAAGRSVFRTLPRRRKYKPLDRDVRRRLFACFAEDIALLEGILDRDLSLWTPE